MATQPQARMSVAQYLQRERDAQIKNEFFDGEVFAMAGASPTHSLIVGNVVTALNLQLKGRDCTVHPSDLRVKVAPTGLFTYPDVVVVCGQKQFAQEDPDTLVNPRLIVEVLSDSTEAYDRGRKFEHYRTIESFVECLLVAQDKCHVERFVRQADHRWLLSETSQMDDTIMLESLSCPLVVADIYAKVTFGVAATGR